MSFISPRDRAFGRGVTGHRFDKPLDDAQLRLMAPSIFADEPHQSRSARYVYIPTIEIINEMRREGFVPMSAKQSTTRDVSRVEHTKHLIRMRHVDDANGTRMTIGGLCPEIVLLNSHDGSSRYKLMAGMFRFICCNGLIVASQLFGEVSVQHSGDIKGAVIEGSFEVLKQSKSAVEVAETWSNLQLSYEESMIFAEAAHVMRFGPDEVTGGFNAKHAIGAEALLRSRRIDDDGRDLFRTFNRIQENCLVGDLSGSSRDANGRRRSMTTRAVKGIDADVRLNRALWAMGRQMAELKAA